MAFKALWRGMAGTLGLSLVMMSLVGGMYRSIIAHSHAIISEALKVPEMKRAGDAFGSVAENSVSFNNSIS